MNLSLRKKCSENILPESNRHKSDRDRDIAEHCTRTGCATSLHWQKQRSTGAVKLTLYCHSCVRKMLNACNCRLTYLSPNIWTQAGTQGRYFVWHPLEYNSIKAGVLPVTHTCTIPREIWAGFLTHTHSLTLFGRIPKACENSNGADTPYFPSPIFSSLHLSYSSALHDTQLSSPDSNHTWRGYALA